MPLYSLRQIFSQVTTILLSSPSSKRKIEKSKYTYQFVTAHNSQAYSRDSNNFIHQAIAKASNIKFQEVRRKAQGTSLYEVYISTTSATISIKLKFVISSTQLTFSLVDYAIFNAKLAPQCSPKLAKNYMPYQVLVSLKGLRVLRLLVDIQKNKLNTTITGDTLKFIVVTLQKC